MAICREVSAQHAWQAVDILHRHRETFIQKEDLHGGPVLNLSRFISLGSWKMNSTNGADSFRSRENTS